MGFNFIENKGIFIIKLIAIAYATILFIMSGFFTTTITDKYIMQKFVDEDEKKENEKSKQKITLELSIMIGILGIIAYILRNIIQEIPFPLNNKFGFDYSRLKELSGGSLMLWALFAFSPVLNNKIAVLRKKILLPNKEKKN